MVIIYKIIIAVLILSNQQILARNSTQVDSTKNDTNRSSKLLHSEHLPKLNLLRRNGQGFYKFQDSSLVLPDKNILPKKSFQLNTLQYPELNSYNKKREGDFEFSKRKLKEFLKRKYEEIPNYNLGKFGQYLGIGKKIFAVILGILSLL